MGISIPSLRGGVEDRRSRRRPSTSRLSIVSRGHGLDVAVGLDYLTPMSPRPPSFGTDLAAGVAAGALCPVDRVSCVGRHRDGVDRAVLGTERAADAVVGDLGSAIRSLHLPAGQRPSQVGLVFVAEVPQRRQDRVGGRLAQPAEAAGADRARPAVRAAPGRPRCPRPSQMRSRISSIRRVPTRQKVHLPHDWSWVKRRK